MQLMAAHRLVALSAADLTITFEQLRHSMQTSSVAAANAGWIYVFHLKF